MKVFCRAIKLPYKWMFYGDDDTLFFPETAAKALQNLDPAMPYFLTGTDFSRPIVFVRVLWYTLREFCNAAAARNLGLDVNVLFSSTQLAEDLIEVGSGNIASSLLLSARALDALCLLL